MTLRQTIKNIMFASICCRYERVVNVNVRLTMGPGACVIVHYIYKILLENDLQSRQNPNKRLRKSPAERIKQRKSFYNTPNCRYPEVHSAS